MTNVSIHSSGGCLHVRPARFAPLRAFVLALGIGLAAAAGTQGAQAQVDQGQASAPDEADPVLAIVNGQELRVSDLSEELRNLPDEARRIPQEMLIGLVLDNVIATVLVAQAAEQAGLAQSAEFERQIAVRRRSLLTQLYLQDIAREALTDDALAAAYAAMTIELQGKEEVRARHILVDEEAEAVRIIAELDGGLDFAEAARTHSTDPSSEGGGDLGFFGEDAMVPEFSAAAFALAVGSHSATPVQTQYGWHVIKVEERRPAQPPPLQQVQQQLRQQLVEAAIAAEVDRLTADATIEKTPLTDAGSSDDAPAEDSPARE